MMVWLLAPLLLSPHALGAGRAEPARTVHLSGAADPYTERCRWALCVDRTVTPPTVALCDAAATPDVMVSSLATSPVPPATGKLTRPQHCARGRWTPPQVPLALDVQGTWVIVDNCFFVGSACRVTCTTDADCAVNGPSLRCVTGRCVSVGP